MIYVASPYTDCDPAVREARFEAACRATAELIRRGKPMFSPIVYGHQLCRYDLPADWTFWQRLDLQYLAMCDEVIVLKLPGWERSKGVQAEIAAARALGKPVTFLDPSKLSAELGVGKTSGPPESATF